MLACSFKGFLLSCYLLKALFVKRADQVKTLIASHQYKNDNTKRLTILLFSAANPLLSKVIISMPTLLKHLTRRVLPLALLILSLPGWLTTAYAADPMSFSTYGLSSGDEIRVSVFGEDDMDVETRLTDAGTISYPFLGEIRVKGMTVGQLQQYLTEKLKDGYFIDPQVNVAITEYRKFFVSGEVKDPGGFSFEPGLTLEKAIALAGGFTQRAARKEVMVTREVNGRQIEREMELDDSVLPGDIISIKESFF